MPNSVEDDVHAEPAPRVRPDLRREQYQSKCYRVVNPENVCELDDTHGYLYGFVSPIDGAKLSEMAFDTLQVIPSATLHFLVFS